jgi:hypothetical protein
MNPIERKKVTVISKYASEAFSEGDWLTLGQITGKLDKIQGHDRLFRSLSFGDDDYDYCVVEVLNEIFSDDPNQIPEVIDHFDIDLWYEQKFPEKYQRIFIESSMTSADFWKEGYLKLFVSHLSENKAQMSAMKNEFDKWGISAFIAHEDIEPSREWRNEVEAALETMDLMVAVVQPGFKNSDWCCQEVGYALGRKTDIIPLRAGMDPFGFFGKYQGIQIKGKTPIEASNEVTNLLLKKPKYRAKLLQSIGKAFSALKSDDKIQKIELLDTWSVATDEQIKLLLQRSALSAYEKKSLKSIINRVKAFEVIKESTEDTDWDDIPF